MAQHDYVIDNSTGANVRADINSALQAIVTNNSGSSAPSSTFPFMLFADSSAGTMKIRNAADNAFIELFQLDGTFTLEDGSASTPGLAFRDDLNTGIFSGGADEFNIATGGTERLMINSDGLTVQKGVTVTGIEGGDAQIRLKADEGDDNNDTYRLLVADGGTGFQIQSFNGSFNTRLIIDSSGRVGIKNTSMSSFNSGGDDLVIGNGTDGQDAGITLLSHSSDNSSIFFNDTSDTGITGLIQYRHDVDALRIFTATAERMRIDSAGTILFGTTSTGNTHAYFEPTSASRMALHLGSSSSALTNIAVFKNTNGVVGNIQTNGSTTIYSTSSDYRLKENAVAISDGISRLKTLKPYRFNFKADESTTLDGFFAHEVTAVPEAVSGIKDEVVTQAMIDAGDYKEGTLNDPIYQGIDQSKLVPLLVAAVQELIGKVEALEAA